MTALLEVEEVSRRFRGLLAVDAVSFAVAPGEIFAVIGPNGAGKTTLFNLIAGALPPSAGTIRLAGTRIDGLRPDQIAARGVGRTFQIVRPFPAMTVRENIMVGSLMRTPHAAAARAKADAVMERLGFAPLADRPAAALTLPDRKRLEVARALATEPSLLLLDEVMAGLRPTEVDAMVATLRAINAEHGTTIVLIEHVMRAVMALAARVLVLHHGARIALGTPAEVVAEPDVVRSYLGTGPVH
jgi:branched-chain amino acid transport system ATP-binding protein